MKLLSAAKGTPPDQWPEAKARVISSDYHYADWRDFNGEETHLDNSYFLTSFSYYVNGELYISEHRTSSEQAEGEKFTIWFDPENPRYNSITGPQQSVGQQLVGWSLLLIFFILFVFLIHHFDLVG